MSHRRSRMVGEGGGRRSGIGVVLARKREVSGLGRRQEMSRGLELRIQIVWLLNRVLELSIEMRRCIILL